MGKHKKVRVGDKFILMDGTEVIVDKYEGATKVTIKDHIGNYKTVQAARLRTGRVLWTTSMFPEHIAGVKVGDEFLLRCGAYVVVTHYKNSSKVTVEDSNGNSKITTTTALKRGQVNWAEFGFPYHFGAEPRIMVGDKFQLSCGMSVTVTNYENSKKITVSDDSGNFKIVYGSRLRKGDVSWHQFGISSTKQRTAVGDMFMLNCGVEVTIVEYRNCSTVVVEDSEGNSRTTDSASLRNGTTSWRQFLPKTFIPSPKGHYVYIVRLCGEIIYIGSGFGRRFMHPNHGGSNNPELNRLFFFSKEPMEVTIHIEGITKQESLDLEKALITKHKPKLNTAHNRKKRTNPKIPISVSEKPLKEDNLQKAS